MSGNFSLSVVCHSDLSLGLLERLRENLVGVYWTRPPSRNLQEFCKAHKLPLRGLRELSEDNGALILMFECYELIAPSQLAKYRWLNLHSGLLPTWRGKSANSWALINNEPKLGFTLHEASRDFDAGNIIKTFEVANDGVSNYFYLREKALRKIEDEIYESLVGWLQGRILSQPQTNTAAIRYCSQIMRSDGVIDDFSLNSRWYVNLSRLFCRPQRSDLHFRASGSLIQLDNVEEVGLAYLGFHSRPLKLEKGRLLVKTGDGAVWITTQEPSALRDALLALAGSKL